MFYTFRGVNQAFKVQSLFIIQYLQRQGCEGVKIEGVRVARHVLVIAGAGDHYRVVCA